jgi:hypothetical protein
VLATTTIGQPGNPCSGECVACPGEVYHNGGWYRFEVCGVSMILPYPVNVAGVHAFLPVPSNPNELRIGSGVGGWTRLSDAYVNALNLGTSYGPSYYGGGSELRLCQKAFSYSGDVATANFAEVRASAGYSVDSKVTCDPATIFNSNQRIMCNGYLCGVFHRRVTVVAEYKLCPSVRISSPGVVVQVLSAKSACNTWNVVAYRVSPKYTISYSMTHWHWGSESFILTRIKCGSFPPRSAFPNATDAQYATALANYEALKATINETPEVFTTTQNEQSCAPLNNQFRLPGTVLNYAQLSPATAVYQVNYPLPTSSEVFSNWIPINTASDLEQENQVGVAPVYSGIDTAALADAVNWDTAIPFDYVHSPGFVGNRPVIATSYPPWGPSSFSGVDCIGLFNWQPVPIRLRLCNIPASNCNATRCFSDTLAPFPE